MDDKPANWDTGLEFSALSDVGLRRSNNQDSFTVAVAPTQEAWLRHGHVFMVADGMGAHAAGELASKMAVDTVPHTYHKLGDDRPAVAIRKAIEDANNRIHSRGQANLDFRGMGTTTSVLLLLPEGALVAHVGDSRVYRLRGNRIDQLSFDHSLVWEMMASGKIRENEVPSYIPKNIITRSLGPSTEVQVDLEGPFPLQLGDTFLLCSDGLSGQVTDEEIGVILGALPPKDAVQVLVDLANLRGGPDNITVIVVRINSLPDASGAAPAIMTSPSRQPVPAAAWIVLGVLLLATLLLALAQNVVYAIGAGVASVVAGLVVLLRLFGGMGSRAPQGERFGRGPHTSRTCLINNEFVDKLAKIVAQLREAATEEHWQVNWDRFNQLDAKALAAAERKDYLAAVRGYGQAVSFMMQEIRSQRGKRNGADEIH